MAVLVEKLFETTYEKAVDIETAIALINKLAPDPVSADTIDIRRAKLANTKIDRSQEEFTVQQLERFAVTIVGKAMLPGHDRSQRPLARIFGGSVEKREDGHHHLLIDYYMRKGSEIAADVSAGIAGELSIGFSADWLECLICNKDWAKCQHQRGQVYGGKICTLRYSGDLEKYEAKEASWVWLGCQYDTGTLAGKSANDPFAGHIIWKSADAGDPDLGQGESEMTEQEKADFDKRGDEVKALTAKVAELETKAKAGDAYLEDLRKEIKRKADVLKEDSGIYAKLLANADLETLKAWDDDIQKRFDKAIPPSPKSQMRGHGAADADQGGAPNSSGRFARPLGGE